MPAITIAPLPHLGKPLGKQDPIVLLAQCIWGESRNQTYAGKIAVGCVVRNRLHVRNGFGSSWAGVLLQPNAFSCFNANDVNLLKLMNPLRDGAAAAIVWNDCYEAADAIYKSLVTDSTGFAVFYHAADPTKTPPRDWGPVTFTVQIGAHSFFKRA